MREVMNKFMQILYTLLSVAVLWACDGRDSDRTDQSYPLDAFSVKVGESWYHAVMDQENRTASFGSLKNGNAITDVRYTLQNAEATISPDPKEFIGKWSESQPVTVTVNGTETTYFIVFPDWDESSLDLLFVDEFDVDGEPDPEKWTLCEKGNVDWNNQMSQSYGQAYVKDGNLVLVGEKKDGEYLAGGIKTQDKFSFTYGRVECRARIPQHPDGAFPAIWMMPQKYIYQGWPACGEIDIMEHVGCVPTEVSSSIHCKSYYHAIGTQKTAAKKIATVMDEFHVYALEWTEEYIKTYVDGVQLFYYNPDNYSEGRTANTWPFNKPFELKLNLAWGGDWGGMYGVDESCLPATYEIDYVRVFQKAE